MDSKIENPHLIFWELTKACNLKCLHCRAQATEKPSNNELTTKEVFRVIDDIAGFCNPLLILSGGEPLLRTDIFEIIKYSSKKLRTLLATEGTMITSDIAKKIKESGIVKVSISLDGSNSTIHDNFRGRIGAFELTMKGIENIKKVELPLQINSSITKRNKDDLPNIIKLVEKIGADAFHIFLLVPTGRGKELIEDELTPEEYEEVLSYLADAKLKSKLDIKATCAPHYNRIIRQKKMFSPIHGMPTNLTKGCLAGIAVLFISSKGDVFPCGYFPVKAGNVREAGLMEIWKNSTLFNELRNRKLLKGKCAVCEFVNVCGGCRARALADSGDYLDEEPYCCYHPKKGDAPIFTTNPITVIASK